MSWRVLVTARNFANTPAATALLTESGCSLVPSAYGGAAPDHGLAGDAFVDLLAGVDAVVLGSARLTGDVLARAGSLKVVSRRGVGYDNIDLDAARARGMLVATTVGSNQEAVADHVFALLLAAARGIVTGHRRVLDGRFEARLGLELPGRTLGIVGLGRVGKGVARRARGFGMRVVACDPVWDDAFARDHGVERRSLHELLAQADVVSVNAALTGSTRGMMDEAAFAAMKPRAIFVNTSRGELVVESALAAALHDGKLYGAGIDVYAPEPPVDSPLLRAPNVVFSAHEAAYTEEATDKGNLIAAETVVGAMHGQLPADDRIIVRPAPERLLTTGPG